MPRSRRTTADIRWAGPWRRPTRPRRGTGGDRAATTFEAQGLRYAVERHDGRLIHSEERRDAQGRVVARVEAEIRYVLGSGARGLSYLIERDGYLFQSPIGWYAQQRRWDLSPGYATLNYHFERPIEPDCLACHANRFDPVEGSVNRYRAPIFQGLSIGCERCHGPGELHVKDSGRTDDPAGRDLTIVNPRHLAPALREGVCEQCHLQGVYHVERAGRRSSDYRPSLPLEEFLAVYVASSSRLAGEKPAVSHVEQMHLSRCYRDSGGRLGCISLSRPASDARAGGGRRILPGAVSGLSCRPRLRDAPGRTTGPDPRRQLHRLPHAGAARWPTSRTRPPPTTEFPATGAGGRRRRPAAPGPAIACRWSCTTPTGSTRTTAPVGIATWRSRWPRPAAASRDRSGAVLPARLAAAGGGGAPGPMTWPRARPSPPPWPCWTDPPTP